MTDWLDIHDTGLTEISGLAAADSVTNRFIIRFNNHLTTLDGFANLVHVGTMFWIYSNPLLCVPAWANDVDMGTGSPTISGNRDGC